MTSTVKTNTDTRPKKKNIRLVMFFGYDRLIKTLKLEGHSALYEKKDKYFWKVNICWSDTELATKIQQIFLIISIKPIIKKVYMIIININIFYMMTDNLKLKVTSPYHFRNFEQSFMV